MGETRSGAGTAASELDEVRVLAGLTPAQRQILGTYLERAQTARGETVAVEAAAADRLAFVLDGQLSIEHRDIAIGTLGRGDHFGIEMVLGKKPHPTAVRTRG